MNMNGRLPSIPERRQEQLEERQRIAELEEYFAEHPWRHGWKDEVPVQTRKTRKMFKDEQFQLMRPSLRREA